MWIKAIAWVGTCLLGLGLSANGAAQTIVNGSFEQNGGVNSTTFTGWTVVDLNDSPGTWFVQEGTASPLGGPTVGSPTNGTFAAMTGEEDPSSTALYQDVTIPAGGATLAFDMQYVSEDSLTDPGTLDYTVSGLEGFRIDLMNPSASVFDTGAGVLANIYITKASDPLSAPYTHITYPIGSQYAGQTVRIRFALTVTTGPLDLGIDNVTLTPGITGVPALSLWGLWAMIATLVGGGWLATRRRFS